MTDREKLLALLAGFGLTPAAEDDYGDAVEPGTVQLQAGHGGVDGYRGFHAAFIFDAEGKFVSAGIWE